MGLLMTNKMSSAAGHKTSPVSIRYIIHILLHNIHSNGGARDPLVTGQGVSYLVAGYHAGAVQCPYQNYHPAMSYGRWCLAFHSPILSLIH